jgi:uncharacterized membrane protein
MKIAKIIIGILLMLAALGNLLGVERMPRIQLTTYVATTAFIFIIGAFLLYSGLKRKDVEFKLTDDDDE